MPQKELLKRILKHISSLSLVLIVLIIYMLGDPHWLDSYLPINGKPLVIFLLIGLVLVYELSISGQKVLICKVDDISKRMEINRLIQSVNALYGRFIDSGDTEITHEYTIKELSELTDMRERLGINSYTQARLEFLNNKVKLG